MKDALYILASIKNSPVIWAQGTHFLIGLCVMLLAYREGVRTKYWRVALVVFIWAFIIETWYDPIYEHDPFLWGGAEDMLFYLIGAIIGMIADYGITIGKAS